MRKTAADAGAKATVCVRITVKGESIGTASIGAGIHEQERLQSVAESKDSQLLIK